MNTPLVSVLVTSFNREKFISACIESILNSAFQDYEVLVVDDCSTDNTVQIVKDYVLKDTRIKLFINDKNVGQFANRNKAASLASGKYLKYLDSDDLIYPNSLSIMVQALERFPHAGVASQCYFNNRDLVEPIFFTPRSCYLNHFFNGSNLLFTGPSGTIIKKEVFNEVGGFDTSIGILADTLFMLKASSIVPFVGLPRGLFHWRRHDEQVTVGQEDLLAMIEQRRQINLIALNQPNCPLTHIEKAITYRILTNNLVKNILKVSKKNNKLKISIHLLRQFRINTFDVLLSLIPNRIYKMVVQ
ncbi:glycosyltransferase family 2 protein [Pontibacter sp. Tf4]|uniref:glycosyltransferase family 2 protein n=1 Tax=Pontibacter sp. Tf4 TaxID=2761620 RepID=UPI00162492FD|nr:glycosyltransferase family 2 protein [Pontibacter sp. Tf4]MBB6610333.1 glycosyltransferase family 2 protein [Pontibacter sp. Tf4]